jgi:predicted ferric reductase
VEDRLQFEPGQLVFVGLDDPAVGRELHPFSITSAVGEQELRLVIKAVGDFTTDLRNVYSGSWARIEGPYGGFWHNGAALPRQVWIAGGIGITPFLSMARSIDASEHAIDLYYATEDADTAVFLDELYTIADRQPTLRVIPIRADALGFLSAGDVRAASGDLTGQHIFMCGPPAMIDALRAQFAELGVPHDRLHYEEFRLKPGS